MRSCWFSVVVAALGVTASGCATRQATAQALTVVGAAAVIVGASMAADSNCYDPGEGAVEPFCSSHLSKGARNVGKGVAVTGVGLAAAGYALTPKGPDRMAPRPSDPAGHASPYRLIRHDPPPEAAASEGTGPESPGTESAGTEVNAGAGDVPAESSAGLPVPVPGAPATSEPALPPAVDCRPGSSGAPSDAARCAPELAAEGRPAKPPH